MSWGLVLKASPRQHHGHLLSWCLDVLKTLSPRHLILGLMDVIWVNILDILKTCLEDIFLSHPCLGWLYAFSSFPPPRPLQRPPPRPPPQQLLPPMSKLFQLNLRYLAQRIYWSGEMYWMTFPWLWPKVKAVAWIGINLLVCAIK